MREITRSPRGRVGIVAAIAFVLGLAGGVVLDSPAPSVAGFVAAVVGVIVTLMWQQRGTPDPLAEGWGEVGTLDLPSPAEGTVITRTFRGKPEDASQEAARYLAAIRPLGWSEVSRTYTPGSYGCGAFLLALVAFVILVGILIFIYMLLVKPPGTLVVTYALPPGRGAMSRDAA